MIAAGDRAPSCIHDDAVAVMTLALALGGAFLPGARAEAAWKPARVTILLGQSAEGFEGRLVRGLARVWSLKLLAPVVVAAQGRGRMMQAADAFDRTPRDGTVVLAADLGRLAIEYARHRPGWLWARTFEHLGVFALDPVFLFAAEDSRDATLEAVSKAVRTREQKIGVGHWRTLETLALHDLARQAGLRFRVQPVGSGASLVAAVTGGSLALALGHASDLARNRDDVQVLAELPALGTRPPAHPLFDRAFGAVAVPAGRVNVITVHARLRRDFPERFEMLKRSFAAAVASEDHRRLLASLGLHRLGVETLDHASLMGAVWQWWDAEARVAGSLAAEPPMVETRGKITALADECRRVRYLGLDGKSHELLVDPDETDLRIRGAAADGAAALERLRPGMICEIAWPSAAAREASRLLCKAAPWGPFRHFASRAYCALRASLAIIIQNQMNKDCTGGSGRSPNGDGLSRRRPCPNPATGQDFTLCTNR